ncbi:hypothetical protein K438DRAFT_1973904 [Mycena galopus ATCC 62051]|nr:hypothetical protein K438DRAFT_1973904 [Mycena galopus ATCC 62051]
MHLRRKPLKLVVPVAHAHPLSPTPVTVATAPVAHATLCRPRQPDPALSDCSKLGLARRVGDYLPARHVNAALFTSAHRELVTPLASSPPRGPAQ